MIPRSLQASTEGIQQAAIAFISTGLTQDEFARQLNLSRSTLTNFLGGKPVYRSNFFKICKALKLNPEEILKPTSELLKYYSKNSQIEEGAESRERRAGEKNWDRDSDPTQIGAGKSQITHGNQTQFQPLLPAPSALLPLVELDVKSVILVNTPVKLSQWFQNIYEESWQSIESVFDLKEKKLASSFRSVDFLREMSRAKLVNLGVQIVGLLIALIPEVEQKTRIRVQVHPAGGEAYLKPNLRLALLSSSGAILQEVQSRSQDNYIQLKQFQCPAGKCFSIQLALDDVSLVEDFVI